MFKVRGIDVQVTGICVKMTEINCIKLNSPFVSGYIGMGKAKYQRLMRSVMKIKKWYCVPMSINLHFKPCVKQNIFTSFIGF